MCSSDLTLMYAFQSLHLLHLLQRRFLLPYPHVHMPAVTSVTSVTTSPSTSPPACTHASRYICYICYNDAFYFPIRMYKCQPLDKLYILERRLLLPHQNAQMQLVTSVISLTTTPYTSQLKIGSASRRE